MLTSKTTQGKGACGRRTRALECQKRGTSKHSKLLGLEICSRLFVISLPSVFFFFFFCGLWQKRQFSVICLSEAIFLHQSKSSTQFFSSVAITSPNTFLTNNFSLSHIFRLFSQPRHCILYTDESDFAPNLVLAP